MLKNVINGVLNRFGVQTLNGPLTNSKSLLISQATLDVIDKAILSTPEETVEQVVTPEATTLNFESQQHSVVEQSIDDVLSNSGREVIEDSIPSLENPAQFMQKYESAYIGDQNVQQMANVGVEPVAIESIPEIKPVQPVIESVESIVSTAPQDSISPVEATVPQYSVPTFADAYVAPISEPTIVEPEHLATVTEPVAPVETEMQYVTELDKIDKTFDINDNKTTNDVKIEDVFKVIDDNAARLKGSIAEMLRAKGYDVDTIGQVVDEEMGRLHK